MVRIFTILSVFFLYSCIEVHPYHCPPVREQYKTMSRQDEKYLDRKHHPFKKPLPGNEKREGYGDGKHFEWLHRHHHHEHDQHHDY